VRKFSGIMRYSQGTATDGLSINAMAYSRKWNLTDQVPLRAIASGVIPLSGELDPTDGGDTSRLSLSARIAQSDDAGSWKANAHVIRYALDQQFRVVHAERRELRSAASLRQPDPAQHRRTARMLSDLRRPVPPARQPRLSRWQRLPHLQVRVCRRADGDDIRHLGSLRRDHPRAHRYVGAAVQAHDRHLAA
jgi:hypothetical protein